MGPGARGGNRPDGARRQRSRVVTFAKTPGAANTGGKVNVSIAMRGSPLNKNAPKSPTGPVKGQKPKPFAVDHAPLQAPVRSRPAPPKPRPVAPPPPDPFEIGTLGPWSLYSKDPLGKRALAKCSHCQTVREISLVDGVPACGCAESWRPATSGFVSELVETEARIATGRHRGRL